MAQKTVWLPELGELTLSKRRGTRNLRITVNAKGQIRVGMPTWTPYSVGISFALTRKDWLQKHLSKHAKIELRQGDRIGKSYRLNYTHSPGMKHTTTRVDNTYVRITSYLPLGSMSVQAKAAAAAERALKKEAQALLPRRVQELAARHDFTYKSVNIKKLSSRWGSCSSHKVITLNYFLMQLPWELIDYVILHELVHTRQLNHSPAYWREFESIHSQAKQLRHQINKYRPVINAVVPDMA
jgi:predicted metal-dependent hydrolase